MGAFSMPGDVLKMIKPDHIKVGDKLEFKASNLDLSDFDLKSVKEKYKVISVVPSLDTAVCLMQTQKFNEKMKSYANAKLITISRDLPFACGRACESFKDPAHVVVSDYNYRDFGNKTGLVFTKVEILCRATLILDEHNVVKYMEIVNPVGNEPDYKQVYAFLDAHK